MCVHQHNACVSSWVYKLRVRARTQEMRYARTQEIRMQCRYACSADTHAVQIRSYQHLQNRPGSIQGERKFVRKGYNQPVIAFSYRFSSPYIEPQVLQNSEHGLATSVGSVFAKPRPRTRPSCYVYCLHVYCLHVYCLHRARNGQNLNSHC